MLSERIRDYAEGEERIVRWADQVAKYERVARAAKEATEIYQIGFTNAGEALAWKNLLAALVDLPEDALKKQQRGCHTVECGARILAGMDCICGFKVR